MISLDKSSRQLRKRLGVGFGEARSLEKSTEGFLTSYTRLGETRVAEAALWCAGISESDLMSYLIY